MAITTTPSPAWSWLLGTTPAGAFRHAPFRAQDPGQGQDPALEPRVEVIQRLIAYPIAAFESLVGAVVAADEDPQHPIRWACHRASGDAPARPYWISFLRGRKDGGRRFVFALELFDRNQIGLWFLSGFADAKVPPDAKAPFPDMPEVSLPRFIVTNDSIGRRPFSKWIRLAFQDRLAFENEPVESISTAETLESASVDHSRSVEATIPTDYVKSPSPAPPRDEVDLRSARARLVVSQPGPAPRIVALSRLATTIGRDLRSDVVIDDRTVSQEHARIVWREGTPWLEDLGSKNGTRIEASSVAKSAPRQLGDEALVVLGRVACLFVRDAEETMPPGAHPSPRNESRLRQLLEQGKITADDAERARATARERGITPAEALVLAGKVTPELWRGQAPAALPPEGCVVLLAALAAGAAATAAALAALSLP
jgi:hypothetical protein